MKKYLVRKIDIKYLTGQEPKGKGYRYEAHADEHAYRIYEVRLGWPNERELLRRLPVLPLDRRLP